MSTRLLVSTILARVYNRPPTEHELTEALSAAAGLFGHQRKYIAGKCRAAMGTQIRACRATGMTYRQIARKLRVSCETIREALQNWP